MSQFIFELRNLTYQIRHNPNCPMPFEFRLIGKGRGSIDGLPLAETGDCFGHGKTIEEAAKNSLKKYHGQSVAPALLPGNASRVP